MVSPHVVLPTHLLLLSKPPWPISPEGINAAYKIPMTSALKHLAYETRKATVGASLDIVMPVPYLFKNQDKPRSTLYPVVQQLVAGVYKLICIIAAKEGFNVEDAEGIDARVLLLAHPTQYQHTDTLFRQPVTGSLIGPLIDLRTLARCQRPWNSVFSVESEEGEGMLRNFLVLQDRSIRIQRIGGVVVQSSKEPSETQPASMVAQHQNHFSIAVGGTWDHLHIGHKLLLTMFAFVLAGNSEGENNSRCLTIGVTGDELLRNKKYAELVESWEDRQSSVSAFLRAIMDFRPQVDAKIETTEMFERCPNGHAVHVALGTSVILKCVEISDPFGPTITDETISALVLSAETRGGGKAVNDKRGEKGWPGLEILEVDVLDAQETPDDANTDINEDAFQNKLSSTSIRKALSAKGRARSKT